MTMFLLPEKKKEMSLFVNKTFFDLNDEMVE